MSQIDRSEGLVGNTAIKAPCRLASTSNVATLNGLLTIDGVVTAAGDRVLLTAQTSGVDNGIYVADTGDWERDVDCDGVLDLVYGTLVKVNLGTANSGFWYCSTTTDPIIVGTTSIAFSMASSTLAVISAFMQTMLDDTTAAAARATLLIETESTVASAATPDIWTGTGMSIDYTGTATATGFAAAPQAGARRTLVCAGAAVFTAGANMIIPGITSGQNFTAAANTRIEVLALTTTQFLLNVLKADGTAVAVAAATLTPASGNIYGCTLSNGTDATNDINIASGVAMDSTNAVLITIATMAGKQLDAGWAPGAAAGMRNSAAAITNATYHIYAVAKADGTQDIYAHTSTTVATVITALQAESGGASYVYARRIGSIIRASATIVAFVQDGDYFQRNASVLDVDVTNPGTAAVTRTLSVPTGLNVLAVVTPYMFDTTPSGGVGYLSDLAISDQAPSASAAPLGNFKMFPAGDGTASQINIRTNTSAQIRSRISTSTANTVLRIATHGWFDNRGRV